MYTHDEWGNTVFHIQTGREGMKILKEAEIKNTMTDEEYKRHMESHNKLQKESSERLWKSLTSFFEKL